MRRRKPPKAKARKRAKQKPVTAVGIILDETTPGHLKITCATCGKPITKKHGMFCEDLCGLEDAKEADKDLDRLAKKIDSLFDLADKGFHKLLD